MIVSQTKQTLHDHHYETLKKNEIFKKGLTLSLKEKQRYTK